MMGNCVSLASYFLYVLVLCVLTLSSCTNNEPDNPTLPVAAARPWLTTTTLLLIPLVVITVDVVSGLKG